MTAIAPIPRFQTAFARPTRAIIAPYFYPPHPRHDHHQHHPHHPANHLIPRPHHPAKRQHPAQLPTHHRNLRRAQRQQKQRRAHLPRPIRHAPRRRATPPQRQIRRLVGQHDRRRQTNRHQQILCDCAQQPRRLRRQHRRNQHQPRHRRAIRRRFPAGNRARLGEHPSPACRPLWHRTMGSRSRRQLGRHASPAMDNRLPQPRAPRPSDCVRAQTLHPKHRL